MYTHIMVGIVAGGVVLIVILLLVLVVVGVWIANILNGSLEVKSVEDGKVDGVAAVIKPTGKDNEKGESV